MKTPAVLSDTEDSTHVEFGSPLTQPKQGPSDRTETRGLPLSVSGRGGSAPTSRRVGSVPSSPVPFRPPRDPRPSGSTPRPVPPVPSERHLHPCNRDSGPPVPSTHSSRPRDSTHLPVDPSPLSPSFPSLRPGVSCTPGPSSTPLPFGPATLPGTSGLVPDHRSLDTFPILGHTPTRVKGNSPSFEAPGETSGSDPRVLVGCVDKEKGWSSGTKRQRTRVVQS